MPVNVLIAQRPIRQATRFNDRTVIRAVLMDEGFTELDTAGLLKVETLELN